MKKKTHRKILAHVTEAYETKLANASFYASDMKEERDRARSDMVELQEWFDSSVQRIGILEDALRKVDVAFQEADVDISVLEEEKRAQATGEIAELLPGMWVRLYSNPTINSGFMGWCALIQCIDNSYEEDSNLELWDALGYASDVPNVYLINVERARPQWYKPSKPTRESGESE